jgi:hypothetical protein
VIQRFKSISTSAVTEGLFVKSQGILDSLIYSGGNIKRYGQMASNIRPTPIVPKNVRLIDAPDI